MAKNNSYQKAGSTPKEIDEAKKAFGERVRSLLNNMGMNQSDLARAAGMPRDSISNYVRGRVWPDPHNLRKVANALHVAPMDLIPGLSEIWDDDTVRSLKTTGGRDNPRRPVVGIQMEQVRPGFFRVQFDQVVSNENAIKIISILDSETSKE